LEYQTFIHLKKLDQNGQTTTSTSKTFIAWLGTIYNTSMYSAMFSDKSRRDAANPDSDVGIVGHNDLKGVTSQHESK